MNLAMRTMTVLSFFMVTALSLSAQAQFMPWGTGMYGAMQSCPYSYSAGDGASDFKDVVKAQAKIIKEAENKLKAKKKDLDKVNKALDKARKNIEDVVSYEYADFLFQHMDNGFACDEYTGIGQAPAAATTNTDKPDDSTPSGVVTDGEDKGTAHVTGQLPVDPYRTADWKQICDPNRQGRVNGKFACRTVGTVNETRGGTTFSECSESTGVYATKSQEKRKLEKQIEVLENDIDVAKSNIEDAGQEYQDKQEERYTSTEGQICWSCLSGSAQFESESRGPDWASTIANVTGGLVAIGLGYQTNKMVTKANSALGWPTQPYPAWGYGVPFLVNGIYGALGGGIGAGGFGCAGGMSGGGFGNGPMGMMGPFGTGSLYGMGGGNGMFGWPDGMMGSPWGGGMYQPGMGPWGMGGPFGGMGMPYPGSMGMPAAGMQMSWPGGYMVNGGMMVNGGYMMPGGGYMMPGMMINGGMMMNGGIGTMSPYGAMSVGMAMGYDMTGMSSMQMQMQQQMMQMQMQQYQVQAQMQQRLMENQMQKQQASYAIQQEISSLVMRLNMIQSGGYDMGFGGGGYLGGGIGGGIGFGIGGGFNGGFNGGVGAAVPFNGGSGVINSNR